jgi:small subunit ribosomal protein S16
MIRIRLRRTGKKGHPLYRVVVANQPDRRDGRFIESLGSYDPHQDPPRITLDAERTREWISKGAQPSESAEKLLLRAGIIEKKPQPAKAKPEARSTGGAKAAQVSPAATADSEEPGEKAT